MSSTNPSTPIFQAVRLAQEGVAFPGAIASAARRHGIDPQLLAAVAAQETGGPGTNAGANIVGDGGHGRGLFQIDDRWHAFARSAAAMDPAKNADYAAAMISGLLKQYGGDVRKALSAYNAGSPTATGTVTQWGSGQRLGYADSVLKHYTTLQQVSGTRNASPSSVAQSPPSETQQQLIAEIFAEIGQLNQMQMLAQSSALPSSELSPQQDATQVQPRSYAQMAGIDSSGHSKQITSWAGLIDSADDSIGD